MAADFFFEPATFDIPTLASLRFEWRNVPLAASVELIVAEYQYLLFHLFILKSVMHTKPGCAHSPTYVCQLDMGVRIGAVKAALLIAGSIVEEVLLAHALKRNYALPVENRRTFGRIIKAWEESGSSDIAPHYFRRIRWLRDMRNNVHLHNMAESKEQFYFSLYSKEKLYLSIVSDLAVYLMQFRS